VRMSLYERIERDRIEARRASFQAEQRRMELLNLCSDIASLRMQLALIKLRRALQTKYRPDQPRVPAGNPDGGQWTSEGGGQGTHGDNTIDVDVTGSTERPPGFFHPGRHHFVPQSVYTGFRSRARRERSLTKRQQGGSRLDRMDGVKTIVSITTQLASICSDSSRTEASAQSG
jgi:hypothetical protein